MSFESVFSMKTVTSGLFKKYLKRKKGGYPLSDIFMLSGRLVNQFECPNPGTQKTFFTVSFFSCISTKNMLNNDH